MSHSPASPDLLPILSRGKHRSPRRGACFMELASFLAGEKWSDSPACTHPLLAEVARSVNDRTSDAGRPLLAPLIPSVIGLTTDDLRAEARIALHCALTALPVAAFDRQRTLAVGVLASDRQLTLLDDDGAVELRERARVALADIPDAAGWAGAFATRSGLPRHDASPRYFRSRSAPSIVSIASRSLAEITFSARDPMLRTMLEGAIEQCRALQTAPKPAPIDPQRWRDAWALTQ